MVDICGGETGCGKKELNCHMTTKKSDVNYNSYEPHSRLANVQGSKDFRVFILYGAFISHPSLKASGILVKEVMKRLQESKVMGNFTCSHAYEFTAIMTALTRPFQAPGTPAWMGGTHNTIAEELLAFDSHMERGSYFSLMVSPLLGCSQTRAAPSPRVVVQHKQNWRREKTNLRPLFY